MDFAYAQLSLLVSGILLSTCSAFLQPFIHHSQYLLTHRPLPVRCLQSSNINENETRDRPNACLVGYISPDQEQELSRILHNVGYENVLLEADTSTYSTSINANVPLFKYQYIKASGMLKLVEDSSITGIKYEDAPKYIPVQSGEENVLFANGWSFLDPDETEPMSAFDIDAANAEGQYKPKWGVTETDDQMMQLHLSTLGFNLKRMDSDEILSEAKGIPNSSREVLLEGGTDKPNAKTTNDGYDFSGSVSSFDKGLFTCAIGGNPLFTTNDLSPLTASSGWLSFFRAVSKDHIKLVYPEKDSIDQRVEVVDPKTGCHLGHYFGEDGFCINANALNFFPCSGGGKEYWNMASHPISWQSLRSENDESSKLPVSKGIIGQVLSHNIQSRTILLGAGCFWHVEYALRRLPGVIETKVGYAGGSFASPTYEDVCKKETQHAEVVKVEFDPNVCDPRKLIDCFLALHDPTIIRAHGKRSVGSGQYRSCIFPLDSDMDRIALDAVTDCRKQLAKLLSTEVKPLTLDSFWIAEDRHQLHDERVKKKSGKDIETLSEMDWLLEYARRSEAIFGSSGTMQVAIDDSDDDGIARMMI